MEPECLLPHSQESATCPYPGPAQSSPHTHLLEIHPNIIHPSTPRSPQWSLSLRFPHQDPIRPPLLIHTRHMPSPSHSSPFYHPHNIGWGVQNHTVYSSGNKDMRNWVHLCIYLLQIWLAVRRDVAWLPFQPFTPSSCVSQLYPELNGISITRRPTWQKCNLITPTPGERGANKQGNICYCL